MRAPANVSARKKKLDAPSRAPRARNIARPAAPALDRCVHLGPAHLMVRRARPWKKWWRSRKCPPALSDSTSTPRPRCWSPPCSSSPLNSRSRCWCPSSKLKSRPVAALELMVDLYLDPDIASPRKVSVWYAFWGEASSRQEYYDICGQKDESFAALVRELIGRLIEDTAQPQLDPTQSRSASSACWK